MNTYAYVGGNPLIYSDPYGLEATTLGLGSAVGGGEAIISGLGRALPGILGSAGGVLGGVLLPSAMGDGTLADAISDTKTGECKSDDGCPPCEPYAVGKVGYQGPKQSVRGIDGTRAGTGAFHYIIFEVQQNPNNCKCRWQETKKLFGHHYYGIPEPTWVNLNGKGRPPSYP